MGTSAMPTRASVTLASEPTEKMTAEETKPEVKGIKMEEVEKHSSVDDLWLVIDGKVYDVTPFMDDHPGGGEIMLGAAGKDGTDDFEDVGHSPHARELLKRFKVGTFKGDFSLSNNGASLKTRNTNVKIQQQQQHTRRWTPSEATQSWV